MVQRYDLVVDDLRQMIESDEGYFVEYEDYAALRKVASMLMENLSDDAELPHETVELMMDLGVFDD